MAISFKAIPLTHLPTNWMVEDLIYPGHTVVCISPDSGFFTSILNVLGIQFRSSATILSNENESFFVAQMSLSDGDWNRDPIIHTYGGEALHIKDIDHQTVYSQKNLFPSKSDQRYKNLINFYQTGAPHEMAKNHLDHFLDADISDITLHTLPLAGGNIITPRKAWLNSTTAEIEHDESPVFLIGRGALILTAETMSKDDILIASEINPLISQKKYIDHIIQTYFTDELEPELPSLDVNFRDKIHYAKQYLAAKTLLRAFVTGGKNLSAECEKTGILTNLKGAPFPHRQSKITKFPKQVLFVNQWSYHIDLQMLYIGCGTILIHDFSITVNFLRNLSQKYPAKQELRDFLREAIDLESKYQNSVNTSVQQITKLSLHVVRVPGLMIPNKTLFSGGLTPASFLSGLNDLSFNFLNSLAIAPVYNQNTIFFNILTPCSNAADPLFQEMEQAIKTNLSSVLGPIFRRTIELTVTTINHGTHKPGSAEKFMLQNLGGFRCQTALVTKWFANSVSKIFINPGNYHHTTNGFTGVRWLKHSSEMPAKLYISDLSLSAHVIRFLSYHPPDIWNVLKQQKSSLPDLPHLPKPTIKPQARTVAAKKSCKIKSSSHKAKTDATLPSSALTLPLLNSKDKL